MKQIELSERMTSLQIAEATGKNHSHVMRDIRNMVEKINESSRGLVEQESREAKEAAMAKGKYKGMSTNVIDAILDTFNKECSLQGYNISQETYIDTKGEHRAMYSLNKKATLLLASSYNHLLRMKIIDRWEELEREHQKQNFTLPTTFAEALRMLADETEAKEKLALENKQKQALIEEQTPKVAFANAIIGSKGSILIGELAKLISQNGVKKIGQNRLFAWMRENGFLGKHHSFYNVPLQEYVESGLFEIKKGTRSGNDGVLIETTTTKVTGKGQEYFVNGFLSGAFVIED